MKIEAHHIVIIILLAICVIMLGLKSTTPVKSVKEDVEISEKKEVVSDMSSHPTTIDIIMQRKSVRKYLDKKIQEETLETIVKAGMAAPTAANKQPWSFVVVTERETLDKLADKLPYTKMLYKAPAAIVVCGVPEWGLPGEENEYWIQDCSAASENILLAAESLKLGAVWTGAYPMKDREKAIREILGIPDKIVPLNVIALGYPTGVEKPKNKFKKERIHREKW